MGDVNGKAKIVNRFKRKRIGYLDFESQVTASADCGSYYNVWAYGARRSSMERALVLP